MSSDNENARQESSSNENDFSPQVAFGDQLSFLNVLSDVDFNDKDFLERSKKRKWDQISSSDAKDPVECTNSAVASSSSEDAETSPKKPKVLENDVNQHVNAEDDFVGEISEYDEPSASQLFQVPQDLVDVLGTTISSRPQVNSRPGPSSSNAVEAPLQENLAPETSSKEPVMSSAAEDHLKSHEQANTVQDKHEAVAPKPTDSVETAPFFDDINIESVNEAATASELAEESRGDANEEPASFFPPARFRTVMMATTGVAIALAPIFWA
eukprot:TRINITY_DN15560_c0_g1_i1.p1 TRINITY_DN15560_c0_g1~~TRINITY_DN15560_c0_g1_i1.p1  ORF type:complete len:269 (-),score=54.80 TRINITY_DN15560_c0_g1_i1:68-874(-)